MFHKTKSINPLNYFNESTKTVRALSFMLSFMLTTFVFTTPTFAAGVEAVKVKNKAYVEASASRMQSSVDKALQVIKQLQEPTQSEEDKATLSSELNRLLSTIEAEDAYAKESFTQMLADVETKGLPDVFKERVLKMQTEYEKRKTELISAMDALVSEHTGNIFTKAYYKLFGNSDVEELNTTKFENNTHQKFDPNSLPFQLQKPTPVKPKTKKEEFISQGFINQPLPHYAALGDFDYSTLADASNPEYLAQSDEVNITQAIQDKAAELDYDVVQIYNYVRNNIEFVPTWGAVQSAELTLGAKRGNAMDISSLLIALLRASKIPARYVHGTIDIEGEELKNWMGGFESFTSAYNYASRGGIPIATYAPQAGVLDKVQMEHIWVEVATDYFPSRGAKNHKADAWIPLDASYKQYEYSKGVDMQEVTGLDLNTTVESFVNSGEVNTTAGYATGFDAQILQDTLNEAQTKIKDYIDTLDANTTTLYDIIGGKKILEEHSTTLASSLCYHVVSTGARYAKLPSSLQQSMAFDIEGKSQYAWLDMLNNGKHTITLPMAKLNNEKVTISFAPATQADEDALNSLLPEGEITDESQLPSSIPLYINVKPQLKLNGKVIQELEATTLGSEYTLKQTLYKPTQTMHFGTPRLLIAGGYYAVNTIVQSISVEKLKQLQAKIKQTQETLQNSNQTQINSLTREDIMGDMVYAASLSYYAQMIAQGKMAVRALDTHYELVGSSGIIGYKPQVEKLFGLPIRLKAGGMNCDLIDTEMTEQSNNDQKKHVQANQQLGIIGSSLEHQVLEQLFATDTQAEGFSAVKAIQLANEQGQKIYTITKENYQEVLPKLQLATYAIDDIRNAAQAGLTITTHEKRISINGYTGEGYIILNERGGGAYLINGGLYGATYSNTVHQQTLFGLSIGTIKDNRKSLRLSENLLKDIVGSFLVILSVTYPKDVKIQPFAGFGAGSMLSVEFQISAAEVMKNFATLVMSVASYHPRFGRITNYLVYWYFYGEGKPVDLHDVYNAGSLFEDAVSRKSSSPVHVLRRKNNICNSSFSDQDTSNVYSVPGLFAIAVSTFFVDGNCDNTTCYYHFYIRDKFEDALDLGIDDVEGNQEAYGSTPYPINYDFDREYPCKN